MCGVCVRQPSRGHGRRRARKNLGEPIKEALRRAVLRLLRHPTCVRRRCVTVVLTPVVVQLAAVTWVRGPGVGVGVVADARWGGNWSGGHHLCDV